MKILLVCMSGITTNVLANKLQQYANQQGYADTFMPCKIGMYQDLVSQVDMILLAPQARFCSEEVKEKAIIHKIPVYELQEEDFVFSKLDRIYVYINQNRKENQRIEVADALQLQDVKHIVSQAIFRCAPIFLIGIISLLLYTIGQFSVCLQLTQITLGIFSFYLMFAIGYEYGIWVKGEGLAYGIISISSSLVMMPTANITQLATPFIRLTNGFIPLDGIGIGNSLFLMILSIITIILLDKTKHLHLKHYSFVGSMAQSLMELPIRYGAIFVIFLCFRVMLTYIL